MSEPVIDFIDPTPYIDLLNVDLAIFTLINPEYKDLDRDDFTLNGVKVTCLDIQFPSSIVNHDPQLLDYNEIYHKYASSNKTERDLIGYREALRELNKRISDKIRDTFMNCINPTSQLGSQLVHYFDTLLFATLFLYDKLWDAYETDFAGTVSVNNSIRDLDFRKQPHYYRAHQQVKYISTLLYGYYKSGKAPAEINIISNHKPHIQNDPILTSWVLQSLIESILNNKLPISTDYYGVQLKNIISKLNNSTDSEALTQLKDLSNSNPPVFVNAKRKVTRRFCLELHKVFCHYTSPNVNNITIPHLTVYVNILKEFKMDDFTTHERIPTTASTKSRKFLSEERLRELLTREDKPAQ
ncbi:hypothetical protein IDJ77_11565 [Mucilaginibacter sp. ZT4R22]|uniref:Uncharacterized protein n=1 Tax=Mucilaginibacter pankratovii TaxID=2772110 RepID=A0ABR7WSF3_9SPHI|nr:hypothetical protein [Mucilaginibacter pankratovii]MBD1364447.1 hypothetical protein [Mucilaginibacter pankratovii]